MCRLQEKDLRYSSPSRSALPSLYTRLSEQIIYIYSPAVPRRGTAILTLYLGCSFP